MLTNRNILTEELENAAILKNLVPIQGKTRIMFDAIVRTLTEKFQKSLEEEPIIKIKVPKLVIDDTKEGIQ